MSLLTSRRRRRVAAVGAAAGLVAGAALVGSPAQALVPNYGVTITNVSPTKVAAGLANRVVIITGTNFDEDQITSIDLGTDPDCMGLDSYVVTSSTSISVKTPGNGTNSSSTPGCAAAAAAAVNINQTGSPAGQVTKAAAITFVNPPGIAASNPISTENSANLGTSDQVKTLTTAGGQIIRIKGDANTTFSGASGVGLSGTYGGKALTTVGFLNPDGTAQATTASGSAGNYWIAKTGTSLSASSNTLSITMNSVSKTFSSTDTGLTLAAVPTITSLDVTSGKAATATTVKITGTGYDTTAANWKATFCGVQATVTASTATTLTVTTPTGVGNGNGGFASNVYAGACPVQTYPTSDPTLLSPITEKTYFMYLTN